LKTVKQLLSVISILVRVFLPLRNEETLRGEGRCP